MTDMKLMPHMIYKKLHEHFGNLNWWPMDQNYHKKNGSDPRFEVIVGAILTQNTAWSNVEKALINLKDDNLIEIKKIRQLNTNKLENMIRPSGFFKQKAMRVKNMAVYLYDNYHSDLDLFFNRNIHIIRKELLSLNGIGPETADSILLYAGNLPIFVVDAYTKRICERLALDTVISYDEIQEYFQNDLCKKYPENELVDVYNDFHAQIVIFAKNFCKKKPICVNCPLENSCEFNK